MPGRRRIWRSGQPCTSLPFTQEAPTRPRVFRHTALECTRKRQQFAVNAREWRNCSVFLRPRGSRVASWKTAASRDRDNPERKTARSDTATPHHRSANATARVHFCTYSSHPRTHTFYFFLTQGAGFSFSALPTSAGRSVSLSLRKIVFRNPPHRAAFSDLQASFRACC